MFNINNDDIRIVSNQLDAVYTALYCYSLYSFISDKNNHHDNEHGYWKMIQFSVLNTLLANWVEVLLVKPKNLHWREITFEQSDYIDDLYDAGGFTYESWTEYRDYIKELMHSYESYPNPYHHIDEKYDLDGVYVSLTVTHNWFNKLALKNEEVFSKRELEKWPVINKYLVTELKNEIETNFPIKQID